MWVSAHTQAPMLGPGFRGNVSTGRGLYPETQSIRGLKGDPVGQKPCNPSRPHGGMSGASRTCGLGTWAGWATAPLETEGVLGGTAGSQRRPWTPGTLPAELSWAEPVSFYARNSLATCPRVGSCLRMLMGSAAVERAPPQR